MPAALRVLSPICLIALTSAVAFSQNPPLNNSLLDGLQLRTLGGTTNSGRIADIAVDPRNRSVWYIAVAAGGVWKTTNRGLTFQPIFDRYGSYSTGCITIDPTNSNV